MGVDATRKTDARRIAGATVIVGAGYTRTVSRVGVGFDGTEGTVATIVHSVADRIVLKETKRVTSIVTQSVTVIALFGRNENSIAALILTCLVSYFVPLRATITKYLGGVHRFVTSDAIYNQRTVYDAIHRHIVH